MGIESRGFSGPETNTKLEAAARTAAVVSLLVAQVLASSCAPEYRTNNKIVVSDAGTEDSDDGGMVEVDAVVDAGLDSADTATGDVEVDAVIDATNEVVLLVSTISGPDSYETIPSGVDHLELATIQFKASGGTIDVHGLAMGSSGIGDVDDFSIALHTKRAETGDWLHQETPWADFSIDDQSAHSFYDTVSLTDGQVAEFLVAAGFNSDLDAGNIYNIHLDADDIDASSDEEFTIEYDQDPADPIGSVTITSISFGGTINISDAPIPFSTVGPGEYSVVLNADLDISLETDVDCYFLVFKDWGSVSFWDLSNVSLSQNFGGMNFHVFQDRFGVVMSLDEPVHISGGENVNLQMEATIPQGIPGTIHLRFYSAECRDTRYGFYVPSVAGHNGETITIGP